MSSTGRRARERTKQRLKASGAASATAKPKSSVEGEPSLRERLRYGFDATMAAGPKALVGWLALLTLVLIVVFSAIVLITGMESGHDTVFGQLFYALMHALDPGTVAGDTGSWRFLLTMLLLASGLDPVSAFTAVIAMVNNTGPGLGVVGPSTNFGGLTDFQTWVCLVGMLLGRLELLSVLVLLTPLFWRR